MSVSLKPTSLLNGQGIDIASLVNQLISDRSGQLQQWQQQQSALQSAASDLTALNTDLSNLATAVSALSDPLGPLAAQSVSSSNPGVVTASASTTSTPGAHQITVANLATVGAIYTAALKDGNTSFLNSGTTSGDIQLQVGGSNGTTATYRSRKAAMTR